MFWKLFISDEKVEKALEQSIGWDISPNIPKAANNDQPQLKPNLWLQDYMPEDQTTEDDKGESYFWERSHYNR